MTAEPQIGYPGQNEGWQQTPAGYGAAGTGMPGYLQPSGPEGGPSGNGPRVGPVVGFTFLFGVFGAISAARRAERARAVGDSTGKYWIAFGATLVGCWVLAAISAILLFAMSVTTDAAASKSTTAVALQQSIVQQGSFTDTAGKIIEVKTASCVAKAVAGPNGGVGTYSCTLGLVGGAKDIVLVNVDSAGRWRVVGPAT